jgi:hypothetical protein
MRFKSVAASNVQPFVDHLFETRFPVVPGLGPQGQS